MQSIRDLKRDRRAQNIESLPDSFLIVHVDAPHLNYKNFQTFATSIQNSLFSLRDPHIGHAWITISSLNSDGARIYYEVGHSGELGLISPRYFDEILQLSERGELNPVRYLHYTLFDGYRECNSGGHSSTFSALFPIDRSSFDSWVDFTFGPDQYDFSRWSLLRHNCLTYVQASLLLCGIESKLQENRIPISRTFSFSGKVYTLWNDPQYEMLDCTTVDSLERWLLFAVQSGRADYIPRAKIVEWKASWTEQKGL
ncbi:MAG: hypothetical protein QRY74_02280 [Chlamydia sp.]